MSAPLKDIPVSLDVPLDADGFCTTFDRTQVDEIRCFFDEFGFVVVHEVVTPEQCVATFDEFWEQHRLIGVDRERPDTWDILWEKPVAKRFSFAGIIGLWSDVSSVRQLQNRQCPEVYDAFATVLRERCLIVDHDRMGVMRPTVAVPYASGPVDRPEWRTRANWLHLDCNPHAARKGEGYVSVGSFVQKGDDRDVVDFTQTLLVQGLISLTDARETDGGFHCVPGSHRFSMEWVMEHSPLQSRDNIQVSEDDPLQSMVRAVPLRQGSLLVWNQLLFHGNHPNQSSRFRAVQYIRMLPVGTPFQPLVGLEGCDLPKEFRVSPLGKNLFGFEDWGDRQPPQAVEESGTRNTT